MLVQYVVGLCCLRHNPDAVDVTVGDLVLDNAAGKKRDVDVTVTIKEEDGTLSAFKAYEVKKESTPLDVMTVEQLCVKLKDMPEVTHRSIISASPFTEGAIKKATAHGVDLLVMKPWTRNISEQFPDFPNTGPPDTFFRSVESSLLYWVNDTMFVSALSGPPAFNWSADTPLFNKKGSPHKQYPNMGIFRSAILLRSTNILYSQEPATSVARTFPCGSIPETPEFEAGPAWPHTHTLQVTDDKAFLQFDDELHAIASVTINGQLQWRKIKRIPQFYIIESIDGTNVFAGAAVADFGSNDGKMLAFTFPNKSREIGVHIFTLEERHRNIIRNLKIPLTYPANLTSGKEA